MSEKDYNIDINFIANTEKASQKIREFEKLLSQANEMVGSVKVDKRSKGYKYFANQINSLAKAIQALNNVNKDRERIENKIAKYSVGDENSARLAGAKEELKNLEKRQANLVAAIKNNPELQKEITGMKDQSVAYEKAKDSLEKFMLSLDPVKQKMAELQEKMIAAKEQFIKLDMATQDTEGAKKSIAKLTKEMEKLQQSTQKSASWASKLMGRIRNIAIYRAIRSGMKWFTSGINEGLQGLAQYSGDVNSTMSNINNSLNQVRNTLAISFASVLQALEPVITKLSDMIVDLVNSFNLAMAKMQGKNVYTKAKKAADDYAKSAEKARKLSFDTFEVLSGGDEKTPTKDLFEEGNVNEDANETSEIFTEILKTAKIIFELGKQIWNEVIKPIIPILLKIVQALSKAISFIISILNKAGLLKGVILTIIGLLAYEKVAKWITKITTGVGSIITTFKNLSVTMISKTKDVAAAFKSMGEKGWGKEATASIKNYFKSATKGLTAMKIAAVSLASVMSAIFAYQLADSFFGQFEKEGKIIAGTLGIVAAALMAVAVAAMAAAGAMSWGIAIPGITAAIGVGVASVKAIVDGAKEMKGYEKGGIPEKSELFYMNENGVPEALVNTGGSKTNVINIEQLSEGMRKGFVEAIYETGLNNDSNITIKIDGNINDSAFARAIYPALKVENTRRGGVSLRGNGGFWR